MTGERGARGARDVRGAKGASHLVKLLPPNICFTLHKSELMFFHHTNVIETILL